MACKLWYSEGTHDKWPTSFFKKEKRQHAPHARMLKDLWNVCRVSFSGNISHVQSCYFGNNRSCYPNSDKFMVKVHLLFFYQTLILQMRKKVLCLVIHAGRWYWSCQYPAKWWHHSSMLANHGDRHWTFKNSMSYHLLRGMSSFFTSAHPCHIMLYSLVC